MALEAFEVQGEWWLPDRPDHRVAGRLKFAPQSGAELSLIGSLRSVLDEAERTTEGDTTTIRVTEQAMDRAGTYTRIVGDAEGHLYTLEDSIRTHGTIGFGRNQSEVISVAQVYQGLAFAADEELTANGVSIELRDLVDWVGQSGITETMRRRKDGKPPRREPWVTLDATLVPDRSIAIVDDLNLKLGHVVNVSGQRPERCLREDFTLRIDAGRLLPVEALIDVAGDLQDLVTVAVGRRATFGQVKFWHPDSVQKRGRRKPAELPVHFFARWADQPDESDTSRVHHHEMLFNFDDLGGMEGVARWLDATRDHRGAIRRVLASRYHKAMYPSDRLMNASAALEGLDRTTERSKNSKFKTRLNRCAGLAGEPFLELVGDIPKWAETMRVERDDIAHHLGGLLAGGEKQYYLAESAFWLFVFCLLRVGGVPDAVFVRLDLNSKLRWLRERLAETL